LPTCAGALLLRNTSDDHVYYIVADELKQIDLSSDQVVAQLFKDGQWEAAAAPLYFGQVRAGCCRRINRGRLRPLLFILVR